MPVFVNLKESLAIKYKIKDMGEIKIIIRWQITRDLSTKSIRVN